MTTDQVSMHHGHKVPSTQMLCEDSQRMKTIAPAMPRLNSIQYHRANVAPASIETPTRMGATHAASPMIGLGNPSNEPCHEPRFLPHCTRTLTLQSNTAEGFFSTAILSRVRANAAHQPITPATMRTIGKAS